MTIMEKFKEAMNKPSDQDQEKMVLIETSETEKTNPQPTIDELENEITSLNQQLQERNIENMQFQGKTKLPEQFENLKTIKVFLECVLLAQDVTKESGQEVKLTSNLIPVGLNVAAKK